MSTSFTVHPRWCVVAECAYSTIRHAKWEQKKRCSCMFVCARAHKINYNCSDHAIRVQLYNCVACVWNVFYPRPACTAHVHQSTTKGFCFKTAHITPRSLWCSSWYGNPPARTLTSTYAPSRLYPLVPDDFPRPVHSFRRRTHVHTWRSLSINLSRSLHHTLAGCYVLCWHFVYVCVCVFSTAAVFN